MIQVYSSLVRSSDLKIANRDNNLLTTMIIDDPTTNYCRSVEDICIPMITRFDRLMFVFRDFEGNIMQLNGEFELQLTIEDVTTKCLPRFHRWISWVWSKCSLILRRRKWSWIILSHSINVPTRQCHSMHISCCTTYQPIKWCWSMLIAHHSRKYSYSEVPTTSIQSSQCRMRVMPSLFELVYSG